MVTDRRIIVSNGKISAELTDYPFYVTKTKGFDRLDVKMVTSQGFNQEGATLINSITEPRDMEITGYIRAGTTMQMQDMRDKLMNIFAPKKEVTINHYYGGRNRMIKARAEKTPAFEFTDVSTVQEYKVQMAATQPYWSDTQDTLVSVANWIGRFHFPLAIRGVVFGVKSASLIANVFNKSAMNTGMRFSFIANGNVHNPQLFNINTREYLKILCDMRAGEEITVQTGEEKTITRRMEGLSEDYIGKIDLAGGGKTFLELYPGDNLFRYAADEGEDMLEIKIYYKNKYVGV